MDSTNAVDDVKTLLVAALGLDADRTADFDSGTRLLGSLPELDSLAVVSLITMMEDRLGIVVDDTDIDSETFETVGSLAAFVSRHAG